MPKSNLPNSGCIFGMGRHVEALVSRVWHDSIAVSDVYLSYYGSVEKKQTRQVSDVAKGMYALRAGMLSEEGVDTDLWGNHYYGEHPYVANLCALRADLLTL